MRAKEVISTTRKKVSAKPGRADPEPEGQATYEMANLRPERTGLPFVVFISQRGGARHDVQVKVARVPRVRPSEMVTVALRPSVRAVRGRLEPHDLALLRQWIDLNEQILIDYWNGVIGYTEDAFECPQANRGCARLKGGVRSARNFGRRFGDVGAPGP